MIAQWRAAFIMTFDVQSSMLLAKGYASPAELSFDQVCGCVEKGMLCHD